MKVICDNCGAMYKIPDTKLVKPVNKATCRQCGHRMLIPRPRRGADPDERTLVTAVPPTPAGAPVRDTGGPPTTPIHEPEEKTAPTGGMAEETRWVRNEVPETPQSGRPRVSVTPRLAPRASVAEFGSEGGAATERVPAHGGPPAPPAPVTPQPNRQRSAPMPPIPEPQRTMPPAPDPVEDDIATRIEEAPARPAAATHDPRGDLGLVLFGVLVAGLGVVTLGITSVLDATGQLYWAVLGSSALGLALAVGGVVGAFLVLVTGGRGRKPAWKAASVILAVLAALIVGALPAGIRAGSDAFTTLSDSLDNILAAAQATPPPEVADVVTPEVGPLEDEPETPDDAVADGADPDGLEADVDDPLLLPPEDADADTPEVTTPSTAGSRTTSSTSGRRSSTSGRATTSGRRSTTGAASLTSGSSDPEPELTAEEELDLPDDLGLGGGDDPEPASGDPSLPASPPLSVIDIQVKTNVKVKKCFFDYQQVEGGLPPRVDVKFTIQPNGDSTAISVKQRKYADSPLETCMIRAIREIQFPASQGGTTLTFPFVFE